MPGKSLASALSEPPSRKAAVCHVVTQAETLKKKADREAVYAAIDDPKWSGRQLATVLTEFGLAINPTTINAHRRGTCPCYREGEL